MIINKNLLKYNKLKTQDFTFYSKARERYITLKENVRNYITHKEYKKMTQFLCK